MKLLPPILFALILVSFFTQCKKGNTPQQPVNDNDTLAPGNYIIRTKYMCDGKAFVLGSFSNREFIKWEPHTPEEIKGIKDDKPYTSNTYIWTVGKALTSGPATQMPAPPSSSNSGWRRVFSIYQKAPDETNWYLGTIGKGPYEDNTGLGIGPSYSVALSSFSDEDLPNVNIPMSYFSVTDSTGRLTAYGEPYWWYFSLPTDPDDICDDYNSAVIWRNSWVCPNTTVIGDAWKWDACAISQLVLEKVD